MKKFKRLIIFLLLLLVMFYFIGPKSMFSSFLKLVSRSNFDEVKVTKHVDGDTVYVQFKNGKVEKVRFIGVNTPETKHPTRGVEYFGIEASEFTKSSILNKIVYLEKDVSDKDRYGRLLRYVWLERPKLINEAIIKKQMFNAILLAQGYAQVSTYPPDVKYQKYFLNIQKDARTNKNGLWMEKDKNVSFFEPILKLSAFTY